MDKQGEKMKCPKCGSFGTKQNYIVPHFITTGLPESSFVEDDIHCHNCHLFIVRLRGGAHYYFSEGHASDPWRLLDTVPKARVKGSFIGKPKIQW